MQTRRTNPSFELPWGLPPELPWARFLRLLRRPDPPRGWLEAAAALEDLAKRPLLLRWIAQHPKAPAHLRARLLGRLPWRGLAAIAQDASAHPQAKAMATERLIQSWPGLSTGERRALALLAPRPLWRLAWKAPDAGTVAHLLLNPKLSLESLLALLQPPLSSAQADALPRSPWRESQLVATQMLRAMDHGLALSEPVLVLGQAAPWIRCLDAEAAIETAAGIRHPALRRLIRSQAGSYLE